MRGRKKKHQKTIQELNNWRMCKKLPWMERLLWKHLATPLCFYAKWTHTHTHTHIQWISFVFNEFIRVLLCKLVGSSQKTWPKCATSFANDGDVIFDSIWYIQWIGLDRKCDSRPDLLAWHSARWVGWRNCAFSNVKNGGKAKECLQLSTIGSIMSLLFRDLYNGLAP